MIAAIVILIAAAVSDWIIWCICRQSLMRETRQTAIGEIVTLQSDLERMQAKKGSFLSDSELQYYFKYRDDDYVICMMGNDMLYNQTILTKEDLAAANTLLTPYIVNKHIIDGKQQKYPLMITKAEVSGQKEQITLYRITNLSLVFRRLRLLAFEMLGVLLCVCVAAVIVLYLVVRRTMKPLRILSDSAKQIAAGEYDERAVVSDRDEIGMLAEDFNRMADAVQEKIASLADTQQRQRMFMADFSHELKTPLTAISGYAQTLRTLPLSEEEQAEALGYIYFEAKRLDRLAKKMMRLMELDKTVALQITEISCEKLLQAVLAASRPYAEKKNVRLKIASCSGCVYGDFDLLHTAICNLTENAVKASNADQMVTISAENHRITVRDEGCGIPWDEIPHLTEPFYMVDKSRSRSAGGAGLGLSIVKMIIQLHNAEMEINSNVGVGTIISLHFLGNFTI